MEKSKLNIAIAGCGKVAHLHAKAIQEIENVHLVAAWSRSKETVMKFARDYNILAYRDIPLMIEETEVDLVIICTPHPFHLTPCIESAESGAHVLVEKPLASTLEDCDRMIDTCRKNNVNLGDQPKALV